MKTILMAVLASTLAASAVQASELYCGANKEEVPGSQVYNKSLFWEKADTSKAQVRYLFADGTVVNAEGMTPEQVAGIPNGTVALGISFQEGRPNLFTGKVKKMGNGKIEFKNTSVAASLDGKSPLLMANGVSVMCKEL